MSASYAVYKILREAGLPPNIVQFVPADGPVFGDTITASEHLAGINFTGSVPYVSVCTGLCYNALMCSSLLFYTCICQDTLKYWSVPVYFIGSLCTHVPLAYIVVPRVYTCLYSANTLLCPYYVWLCLHVPVYPFIPLSQSGLVFMTSICFILFVAWAQVKVQPV